MTAELAVVHPPTEVAVSGGMNPIVGSLVEWAESARAAHQISLSLVDTSFVPAQFKGKPNEATAAILAGAEVGLSPMAALRSFDVISGVAAPRAITQRAVVQSQGHDVWVVEATDTKAVVEGQRRGSTHVQRSVWTVQRATALGLMSKDNWKKQPGAMLVARATAECCRMIASDAMLGIGYSSEEIADGIDDSPAAPAPRRTAKRSAPKPETPEPSLDDEPAAETPEEKAAEAATGMQDEGAITPAQLTKLNIQLQENGFDDRDEKLRFLSLRLGRSIESSKDLSLDEASHLIDAFENGSWQEPVEPPLDES